MNTQKLTEIIVSSSLKDQLAQGHPWIYRNHVPPNLNLASGCWVKLRCGGWKGYGLWDNRGPIAVRVFSREQVPDRKWLEQQIQTAWNLRSPLRESNSTAYRWLFGEGDGLPGITVDLYDRYAVVQTYMEGARALIDNLVEILPKVTELKGILWRTQHEPEAVNKIQLLWGQLPPENLIVEENGLKFQVNLAIGQKTGLFLDHRENRSFIEGLSDKKQVLNCFAYTGGFSLYALRGNAQQVVSVDIGKGLAEAAEINVKLNHLNPDRHKFITADCFNILDDFYTEQTQFDIVILDPPSFAKTKQNRFAAIRAYTKLNASALKLVNPNGLLVSASCTSQISPQAFQEMLAQACNLANRKGQIIHEASHALDHPIPIGFTEGRYLKFVVLKVANYS